MLQYVDIKSLTFAEDNPRTITEEELEKLAKSIEEDTEYFNMRPCLVNKVDGKLIVYAGNQRIRACEDILKWKQVPCIVDENATPETIKKRILLDNLHSGDWDWDELANQYDTDFLLNIGFSSLNLGLEEPEKVKSSKKEKKPKESTCPSCGYSFSN